MRYEFMFVGFHVQCGGLAIIIYAKLILPTIATI